ncbi:MAG: DUF2071 domain-containing protein [Acidobacteriota bacterium]|nr:DUF2071 domain-containing protein [Acidobacteriota bacterium]
MEHDVQTQFVTAGSLLYEVEHRPWLPPDGQWLLSQRWNDLLMMHFAVEPAALRRLVPDGLTLELYDGAAWLTVMAFATSHARPSGVPPLPGLSFFPQINLRTYVTAEEKPGGYYLSVDCGNLSAVWFARMFFRLEYWHASMQLTGATIRSQSNGNGGLHYRARRLHGPSAQGGPARLEVDYAPVGEVQHARQHSLDEFLSERYCIYSQRGRHYYRIEVHHQPWPLQRAEADLRINSMAEPLGLLLPEQPQICHFSRSIRLLNWAPERIASLE